MASPVDLAGDGVGGGIRHEPSSVTASERKLTAWGLVQPWIGDGDGDGDIVSPVVLAGGGSGDGAMGGGT